MKIKTSELIGPALDWAVAKCGGWIRGDITDPKFCRIWRDFQRTPAMYPSTDWSHGGPIIDREKITIINADGDDVWSAYPLADDPVKHRKSGPTPLIAAMRCFCASRLGDEVEVPDELAS